LLAFVTDGEVDQGHELFGRHASFRLRKVLRGRWREIELPWPCGMACVSIRLGQLIDALARELEAPEPPETDPLTDAASWEPYLERIAQRVTASGERIFVRHVLRIPHGDDAELLEHYLRHVWARLGRVMRPGGVVLGFEVVRAERRGFPWASRAWRVSRRERLAGSKIVQRLDDLDGQKGLRCAALQELRSVSAEDLVDWLRKERSQPRERATREAKDVLAATRGGRFELVVHRLRVTPQEKER
jgi:hypothetical protein